MKSKAWKHWTDLKSEDKLELLRSEMFLTSGFNNLLFFGLLCVVAVAAPYSKFTIWVPAAFLLITTLTTVERWKQNNALVDSIRGAVIAGVAAAQKERKEAKKEKGADPLDEIFVEKNKRS